MGIRLLLSRFSYCIKQFLCRHEYRLFRKPGFNNSNPNIVYLSCVKCNHLEYRKLDKSKMTRTNYIWCSKCGFDLVNSDSTYTELQDALYEYECASCGYTSMFDFAIGPGPVEVDSRGNIIP